MGFTTLCSLHGILVIVSLLQELYAALDAAALECGVFRSEIIGDAIMAVCGHEPGSEEDHTQRMVGQGLGLQPKFQGGGGAMSAAWWGITATSPKAPLRSLCRSSRSRGASTRRWTGFGGELTFRRLPACA